MSQTITLPRPTTTAEAGTDPRWRPTRAGLIALWRYWDETFAFHRGRLLLRGPNGSGKSMALELLLPFLLDADASPSRLSSASRSRGGLFERIMTGTDDAARTGFAWVEFQRGAQFITLGARLRTSAATRKVDPAYFTTSQRVGIDLQLLGADRVPLSKRDLETAIGERGRVHPSAESYRDAVRTTLFPGFSADRYTSMLTALLALRKEKLSQNLDLDKLSEVLSDALTPVDEHDLAAVAEGFERLDRRRAELDRLANEVAAVSLLADRQRDYARAVLRQVTGEVRSAETRRDDVTRTERTVRAQLTEAVVAAERLDLEAAALDARLDAIGVERDALRDRDAYRVGTHLQDLRVELRRLTQNAGSARQAADLCQTSKTAADETAAEADARLADSRANTEQARADLLSAAASVGAEAVIDGLVDDSPAAIEDAERVVEAWAHMRRGRIDEVRTAVRTCADTVLRRDLKHEEAEKDLQLLEERRASAAAIDQILSETVAGYAHDVTAWAADARAIPADQIRTALPSPPDIPERVGDALSRLGSDLHAEHEVAVAAAVARHQAVLDERARVADERQHHVDGLLVAPEPPPWRDDRTGRAGAPLWQLVETSQDSQGTENQLDGIEAALAAAGLLDAWVTPDGTVDLAENRSDLTLGIRPIPGPSLSDHLVAVVDGPVDPATIGAVLGSIAVVENLLATEPDRTRTEPLALGQASLGTQEVLVCLDGSFRLGAATGRGDVRPAVLLGSAARERRRLERLAELDAELRTLDDGLAQLDRDRQDRDRRRRAVLAELIAVPDGAAVLDARTAVDTARVRCDEAEERRTRTQRDLATAEHAVRDALRSLHTLAALHGLPTDAPTLDEVTVAVSRLERANATCARRAHEAARARADRSASVARAEAAAQQLAQANTSLAACERQQTEAQTRVHTLESTVGAEYREIDTQLTRLDDERGGRRERQRVLSTSRPAASDQVGRLTERLGQAEKARAGADDDRTRSQARLVAAVVDGLASDAGVVVSDVLDSPTAVLSASRELAAALGAPTGDGHGVDRTAARLQERLHQTEAALGGRSDLDRRLTDHGWWTLTAIALGLRRSVRDLAAMLQRELDDGRQEFLADEERLFEEVLAGSIRRSLAARIRLANQLVDAINDQLDVVRTAAGGVGVRLRWDVDRNQPDAVRAARQLLLRDPQDLSDAESGALLEFVRARVEQARVELESSAPWDARLRETLDYRAWHRFTVQIAHRDWDGFQPATTTRMQRLSTGERSIVLHLPMIASIAALYADERGEPSPCPRLILLDELFAGVDPANRQQLFGTFTTWGLDAVFTSDHEWCQYASLDGIAIHHLHPSTGDDPVTSTRFTWDGKQRVISPDTV